MVLLDFGSLWISAYLLVGRLNAVSRTGEKPALAFAWALGLKSLVLFAFYFLGIEPQVFMQTGVSLAALVLAAIACWKPPLHEAAPPPVSQKRSPAVTLMAGVLGVLFLLSAASAWFFPITEGDGIWYHLRGMILAREGDLDPAVMNAQFRQYPPFVPLLFSYLISQGIETVKPIFPFFYLCLLVIFYFRLVEDVKNRDHAAGFTLILGTTPYFWWHSALPFLDLATGFYFSAGAMYWYFMIQGMVHEEKAGVGKLRALGLTGGICCGMAAWTRPEFLLYNAIPLLILIGVLGRTASLAKKEKNKILLSFALPLLFFSTLWFLTLLTFDSSLEKRVVAVGGACVGMWLLVLVSLVWNFNLQRKQMIGIGVLAVSLYLALMMLAGPERVPLWKGLSIGLLRSASVHVFYVFTAALVLFLFLEDLKKISAAKKLLGVFLIFYSLAHFAIFSYSEPKWVNFSAYVDAVAVHPGHSINLSDTRAMLAFYPVLVFFIAGLPVVRRGLATTGRAWIGKAVSAIVAGNLVILCTVFIAPRAQFILSHGNLSPVQIRETAGSADMPNPLSGTYQVVDRIRRLTPEDATVFMPPGNRLQGSFRSAVIQVLYPRTIIFGDDGDFANLLKTASGGNFVFFVYGRDWQADFCGERRRLELSDFGFGMCRLDS